MSLNQHIVEYNYLFDHFVMFTLQVYSTIKTMKYHIINTNDKMRWTHLFIFVWVVYEYFNKVPHSLILLSWLLPLCLYGIRVCGGASHNKLYLRNVSSQSSALMSMICSPGSWGVCWIECGWDRVIMYSV